MATETQRSAAQPQTYVPPPKIGLGPKLAVGAVAGIIGTSVVFPIDMVKTRLQTQRPGPNGELMYRGPVHTFRTIVAREGTRGLYRGLGANLVGVTPEKALKLAVNDLVRDHMTNADGSIAFAHEVLAGATAGFCQVIATNPMEIVKIRLQMQALTPNEPRQTAVEVARHLGVRGMYRGVGATLLRDVPFSFVFFPMYSQTKLAGTRAYLNWRHGDAAPAPSAENAPFFVVLLSGAVSGATAAAMATPMDVIKTRLQEKGGRARYSGVADCVRKVYAQEGPSAFAKGIVPRMAVQAPLFGTALLAFEVQKLVMARWATQH